MQLQNNSPLMLEFIYLGNLNARWFPVGWIFRECCYVAPKQNQATLRQRFLQITLCSDWKSNRKTFDMLALFQCADGFFQRDSSGRKIK